MSIEPAPPATPYVYAPPPPRGLSIAALVLGIVGLFVSWFVLGIPSILAVVFGHIGLRREPAGRGMAIAGLVTGYLAIAGFVVFVLVTVVLTILIPLLAVGAAGVASYSG